MKKAKRRAAWLVLLALSGQLAAAPAARLDTLVEQVYRSEMLDYTSLREVNSLPDLRVLRNAVYAKKGYRFKSSDLTAYFSRFDWYQPLYDAVEDQFSETDLYNLERILYREADLQVESLIKTAPATGKKNLPSALIGIWQDSPVMASGWGYCLALHPNGVVVERYSQMDCAKRLVLRLGSWELKDSRLHIRYTHRLIIQGGRLVPAAGSCGSEMELIEGRPVLEAIPGGEQTGLSLSAEKTSPDYPAPWRTFGSQKLWKMTADPWGYE